MIREAVATGETVEVAFANACRELGVDTTEAQIEVIDQPAKKTLGLFGGHPARVRAYIEEPDLVEEEPHDPIREATQYLQGVLSAMGLPDVSINVKEEETGAAFTLNGENLGFIIGHRGETLDALQYLASLVANHVEGSYFRLTLDVGNYREKRKETLEALGRKMAFRAVKSGRNSSLEPMNPYERRIIHTAVQTVEGAKSWSEGEDLSRHVVIGPEGGERPQRRDNRRGPGGGRRGGYDRDRRDTRPARNSPRASSAPRAGGPKSDDPSAPIYGKIEAKK